MALEDFLPTAILLPSLGRPQRLEEAAKNIHDNTDLDHQILWCVNGLQSKKILDMFDERYIDDSSADDQRYVTRMNKLIAWAVRGGFKTVFFGSDDVVHHSGWLEKGLETMEAERKAVVVVNDARNPNGTQALVWLPYRRFLVFDDPELAFHPGYQHNYADTEMFATAMKYHQHVRAMESIVEHLHPNYQRPNSRPVDDTYRNAFQHWTEDGKRFGDRMELLKGEAPARVDGKHVAIAKLWANTYG